eukprot:INCI19575.1.p1 GENE.INCI19575.1~~INCI19575.1.p1  ORF type:complete len:411 (-),score=85.70 INCI19575.1:1304-2536(-)
MFHETGRTTLPHRRPVFVVEDTPCKASNGTDDEPGGNVEASVLDESHADIFDDFGSSPAAVLQNLTNKRTWRNLTPVSLNHNLQFVDMKQKRGRLRTPCLRETEPAPYTAPIEKAAATPTMTQVLCPATPAETFQRTTRPTSQGDAEFLKLRHKMNQMSAKLLELTAFCQTLAHHVGFACQAPGFAARRGSKPFSCKKDCVSSVSSCANRIKTSVATKVDAGTCQGNNLRIDISPVAMNNEWCDDSGTTSGIDDESQTVVITQRAPTSCQGPKQASFANNEAADFAQSQRLEQAYDDTTMLSRSLIRSSFYQDIELDGGSVSKIDEKTIQGQVEHDSAGCFDASVDSIGHQSDQKRNTTKADQRLGELDSDADGDADDSLTVCRRVIASFDRRDAVAEKVWDNDGCNFTL